MDEANTYSNSLEKSYSNSVVVSSHNYLTNTSCLRTVKYII